MLLTRADVEDAYLSLVITDSDLSAARVQADATHGTIVLVTHAAGQLTQVARPHLTYNSTHTRLLISDMLDCITSHFTSSPDTRL